jgi:hypothetical protein
MAADVAPVASRPAAADAAGVTRSRSLAVAAAVLLPLCAWGWSLRAGRLEVQRRAGAAASQVAGRPVEVRCPGQLRRRLASEIHDGSVRFDGGRPADETRLTGRVCDGLARLIEQGARLELSCLQLDACASEDTSVAYAVAVLTHEAVHLRGVIDEAATECQAIRRSDGVARALGATAQAAAFISDWQFSVAGDRLPDRYRSSADCRVAAA